MGIIYPQSVIDACGAGILNAHIGKLPEFRGRSVMEWSIFSGAQTGVTVFFIDEGIDTGPSIVFFRAVEIFGCKGVAEAKACLFDMTPELYADALTQIDGGRPLRTNDLSQGCRYYEMSNLFRLAIEISAFN